MIFPRPNRCPLTRAFFIFRHLSDLLTILYPRRMDVLRSGLRFLVSLHRPLLYSASFKRVILVFHTRLLLILIKTNRRRERLSMSLLDYGSLAADARIFRIFGEIVVCADSPGGQKGQTLGGRRVLLAYGFEQDEASFNGCPEPCPLVSCY